MRYLACAAAIAVLDVIREEKLMGNAANIGGYLIEKIKKMEGVKEVRGKGLMIGVELHFNTAQVRNDLVFKHQIFTGSASNKNTVRLLPPLTITKAEADHFIKGFTLALQPHLQSVSK